MAKKANEIEIPALDIKKFALRIIGDSPFICHAWDEKAKTEMLEKQQKKASKAKEIRRPAVEFANSLYWLTPKPDFDAMTDEQAQETLEELLPKSKFGFPITAFKAAALDGGFQQGLLASKAGTAQLARTTARGAFHILGEFAEIEGTPTIREDMVRIGMGTATLRYRGEFKKWATTLMIKYNASAISMEQIVHLFNVGGFSNGIGEWRPAKDGSCGTFHVAQG